MEETPGIGETLTPDVRVNVALNLRGALEDWIAQDQSRQGPSAKIWNDLQVADVPGEDEDADAGLKRASREMILSGIITSRELDGLIASAKADFEA